MTPPVQDSPAERVSDERFVALRAITQSALEASPGVQEYAEVLAALDELASLRRQGEQNDVIRAAAKAYIAAWLLKDEADCIDLEQYGDNIELVQQRGREKARSLRHLMDVVDTSEHLFTGADGKHETRESLLARVVEMEKERRKLMWLGGDLLYRCYDRGDPPIYFGHTINFTDDDNFGVWTEEAAANGGDAAELFLGETGLREAFCWLAKIVPDEVSE